MVGLHATACTCSDISTCCSLLACWPCLLVSRADDICIRECRYCGREDERRRQSGRERVGKEKVREKEERVGKEKVREKEERVGKEKVREKEEGGSLNTYVGLTPKEVV